jgi:hypothetical protein
MKAAATGGRSVPHQDGLWDGETASSDAAPSYRTQLAGHCCHRRAGPGPVELAGGGPAAGHPDRRRRERRRHDERVPSKYLGVMRECSGSLTPLRHRRVVPAARCWPAVPCGHLRLGSARNCGLAGAWSGAVVAGAQPVSGVGGLGADAAQVVGELGGVLVTGQGHGTWQRSYRDPWPGGSCAG